MRSYVGYWRKAGSKYEPVIAVLDSAKPDRFLDFGEFSPQPRPSLWDKVLPTGVARALLEDALSEPMSDSVVERYRFMVVDRLNERWSLTAEDVRCRWEEIAMECL